MNRLFGKKIAKNGAVLLPAAEHACGRVVRRENADGASARKENADGSVRRVGAAGNFTNGERAGGNFMRAESAACVRRPCTQSAAACTAVRCRGVRELQEQTAEYAATVAFLLARAEREESRSACSASQTSISCGAANARRQKTAADALEEGFARLSALAGLNVAERAAARFSTV